MSNGQKDPYDEIMRELALEYKSANDSLECVNWDHITEIVKLYRDIKSSFSGTKVKICLKLHEPFKDCGYISVKGAVIDVSNPAIFSEAFKVADSCELYSQTNGIVVINFGFDDLMK